MKVAFTNGYPAVGHERIHEVIEMEHAPAIGDRVSFDQGDGDYTVMNRTWNLRPGEGQPDAWVTVE